MKSKIFDVALTQVSGLGHRTIRAMLEHFESAEAIFNASESELQAAGMREKVIYSLKNGNAFEKARPIVAECEAKGVKILVCGSSEAYPALLGECYDAPHVLYVYGDFDFNAHKLVSIVGTRRATKEGVKNTQDIVKSLAESYDNVAIVSGLAFGIDKEAHSAAIKNNIPTVAILPGWVLDITPRAHIELARSLVRAGGAIISDIAFGTSITKNNFLSRNRLIAGISSATMVIEAPERSGSTSTANMAHSYSRSVFAIAGRTSDKNAYGTNMLIKTSRAILYQDISDLSAELGWVRKTVVEVSQAQISALPHDQKNIYEAMPQSEPITLEELCAITEIGIGSCCSALVHLEAEGLIKSIPGGMYIRMRF